MNRRRRRAGAIAAAIGLLLVASLVVTGLILVYKPLPTIDGEHRLIGLDQRAEVLRDAYGVPHIYAQNARDLFYLQGYVTAQDRLFQMDLYRRAGAGRLAEVLGEPALDSDKQFRTLGFTRVAAQELRLLREDTRANLTAYADGVNKFLEQHLESLPIEFVILGYHAEQWSALDSLVVAKLQAYDAANNLDQELLRAGLASRFGTGVLTTLMPDPSGQSASVDERAWAAVAPYLSAGTSRPGAIALSRYLPGAGKGIGSNCWALAGSRTSTGKPIVAGDPHLAVRNPSFWYEIGLEDATRELVARFGTDTAKWRWGDLHTITFEHPLAIGPLALLLNIGPLPRSGDGFSVNNGAYDLAKPYKQTTNASERMIADLSDLDNSLSVTPVGQSGQPGSKYWGDQVALWNANDYKPMRFSKDRLGKIDGLLVFRPR